MNRSALLALCCLAACGEVAREALPEPAEGDAPVSQVAAQEPTSSVEHVIEGHGLRLIADSSPCALEHKVGEGSPRRVPLDVRPPCHLLLWSSDPPPHGDDPSVSDGEAVGRIGTPRAWRYPSADAAIVLAVIGDPIPEAMQRGALYDLRKQQGLSCASSLQGLLLRGERLDLSAKREHVGIFCAETGIDEREFWLLAHP